MDASGCKRGHDLGVEGSRRGAVQSRIQSALARMVPRLAPERGLRSSQHNAAPPSVGYVVHGRAGLHPATAHIRVTRRINRAVVAGWARASQVDPERLATGADGAHYDVMLVQRDAVPPALVSSFVAQVRERGARLVVDVDDDFFTPDARARLLEAEYTEPGILGLEALVRSADAVMVATDRLAEILRAVTPAPVAVVPNELDPEFWVDHPGSAIAPPHDGVHRVLYTGSTTHAADLAMLERAFDGLLADDGRPIRLELAGVTDADPGSPWYDRLAIPEGWTHYPEFVRWMRRSSARWDVSVAPLADTPFNRAKSDLKALDGALLGLPVVAADREPYRRLAGHGIRLVGDEPDDWRSAIRGAVSDPSPESLTEWVLAERMLGHDPTWDRVVLGMR